jgi:hypothetical protein
MAEVALFTTAHPFLDFGAENVRPRLCA